MGIREYILRNLHNYDTTVIQPLRDQISTPKITADIHPNTTVGGIQSGSTIAAGTNIEEILNNMLVVYKKPIVSLVSPSNSVIVYGHKFDATLQVKVTQTSQPIQYVDFKVNGTSVEKVTSGLENANNTTITCSNIIQISDTTSFTVDVYDGKSITSVSTTISFANNSYIGLVDSSINETNITETNISSLTFLLLAKKTYSYNNVVANKQRVVYAYPVAYGELSSIVDSNGVTLKIRNYGSTEKFTFTKKTVSISTSEGAVDYYVYITVDPVQLNASDGYCYNFK